MKKTMNLPSGGKLDARDGKSHAPLKGNLPTNPTKGIEFVNASYNRPGKGDSYKKSGSAYKNG